MFLVAIHVSGFSGGPSGPSNVSKHYIKMFQGMTIKEWTDFPKLAAKMYVGKDKVVISSSRFKATKWLWQNQGDPVEDESSLVAAHQYNLMKPANEIFHPRSSRKWSQTSPPIEGRHGNSKPDFCCMSSDRLIVPGEMKRPHLELGEDLTAEVVQGKLAASFKDLDEKKLAHPFIQCFSHMAHSENGVGILSNYNETRYFWWNLNDECIYMSPVVLIDQVWDKKEQPHPLQAMLFARSFTAESDEFTREKAEQLVQKAKDEIGGTLTEKEKKSDKGGKGGGKKGKKPHGGSGGRSSKGVTAVALGLDGPLPDVSLVSANCKHLRILGEGASGYVWECLYKRRLVALKMGLPFNPRFDENDQFEILNNEIEMYNKLLPLQGKWIPRVVAGGYEPWFTPEGMALITEKVGHALVRDKKDLGVFYVDGKKLSEEEIEQVKESGVEGLRAIHMFNVRRRDASILNLRVEREKGRFRVWWIDLGFAEESYKEESKEHEVESFLSKFDGERLSKYHID